MDKKITMAKANHYAVKNAIVSKYLEPLLKEIDSDIDSVYYTAIFDGEERVTVTYNNGHEVRCCVTADSNISLCRDVLKRIN